MDSYKLMVACKNIILDYIKNEKEITDKKIKINIEDVYVVWSVKVLQNNKFLMSTTSPDGLYYELTYNGDKEEVYVDVYKKWKNYVVKRDELNYKVEDNYEL